MKSIKTFLIGCALIWMALIYCVNAASLPLLSVVNNPFPATNDAFGVAVAAVGADRILVGAQFDQSGGSAAGDAYLFTTQGELVTMFTNPAAADRNEFGEAVAAFGNDRVVIGAYQESGDANWSGAVYLFNTNGTLLRRVGEPSPNVGDGFGSAILETVDHHLLVGAPGKTVAGLSLSGVAYLIDTNGVMLAEFTNSTSASRQELGYSLAAPSADLVVLGAPATPLQMPYAIWSGAAYLYSAKGNLIRSFVNPSPGWGVGFGSALASFGTNRVVIGAYGYSGTKTNAGIAYLFDLDGNLLTTFNNPDPTKLKGFGISIAPVGTNRLVIGAVSNSTTGPPGLAYLFQDDGTLLATIRNPSPAVGDGFGFSVAAFPNGEAIVGAPAYNSPGAAYLFGNTPVGPPLLISRSDARTQLSWENDDASWTLQKADELGPTASWLDSTDAAATAGSTNTVEIVPSPGAPARFFRLRPTKSP